MILLDTSVLIDFLANRNNASTQLLNEAIDQEIPLGICGIVLQEVLQGVATRKDFEKVQHYLESQIIYDFLDGSASYIEAARLYFNARKKGKTIRGSVDCMIAQIAIENNLSLLHNDRDFDALAMVEPKLKIWKGIA